MGEKKASSPSHSPNVRKLQGEERAEWEDPFPGGKILYGAVRSSFCSLGYESERERESGWRGINSRSLTHSLFFQKELPRAKRLESSLLQPVAAAAAEAVSPSAND